MRGVTTTFPANTASPSGLASPARTKSDPGDLYVHLRLVMPRGDEATIDRWVDQMQDDPTFDPRADVAL